MMSEPWISIALYLMYGLIGLCILAIIVSAIAGIVKDPRKSIMSLISVAALLVILGIGWAIASGDVPVRYAEMGYTSTMIRWIDAALVAMYILMIGAFILLIVMEIMTAFK